jgi:hypothetical protein
MLLRLSSALLLLLVNVACTGRSAEIEVWSPMSGILARIDVARAGDPLLAKVRVGGAKAQFLIDTGSAFTVLDRTLLPRDALPLRKVEFDRAYPAFKVAIYDCPKLSVEGIDCPWIKHVQAGDLAQVRTMCGGEVGGILGMDVLSRFALHCDLDRKHVLICDSAKVEHLPRGSIPLAISAAGLPVIGCTLGNRDVQCEIDTGGFGNGSLTNGVVREQLRLGTASRGDGLKYTSDVGGNEAVSASIVCHSITCGEVECCNISFRSGETNRIGMYFLARFAFTMDFPKGKAYFVPGKRLKVADRSSAMGMALTMASPNELLVSDVLPDTVAANTGFMRGDKIVQIDHVQIADMHETQLARALYFPATDDVLFGVIRGGKSRRIVVPGEK